MTGWWRPRRQLRLARDSIKHERYQTSLTMIEGDYSDNVVEAYWLGLQFGINAIDTAYHGRQ